MTNASGIEYIVDGYGCDAERLRSLERLQELFARAIADLHLNPVGAPLWHVFGGHGGITGLQLLAESHLAIHTYPESGLVTINLYCCRPMADWDWPAQLRRDLGAARVEVRTVLRGAASVSR